MKLNSKKLLNLQTEQILVKEETKNFITSLQKFQEITKLTKTKL
jgi:hypothetical protein